MRKDVTQAPPGTTTTDPGPAARRPAVSRDTRTPQGYRGDPRAERRRAEKRRRREARRRSPLGIMHSNMTQRCKNPRNDRYPSYGGRGIHVCKAWRHFPTYARDVGQPPNGDYLNYSLDRIDVDGDYAPGNVRWVLKERQARNKQDTVRVEVDGETKPMLDVLEETGSPLKPATVRARLRRGKDVEEALHPELGGTVHAQRAVRDEVIAARLREGELFVTAEGVVLDLHDRRVLTPSRNPDGYVMVDLPRMGKHGVCGRVGVHRLVALQHLTNPDPERYLVVHHLDGDKANPSLTNLRWSTPEENRRAVDGGGTHAPMLLANLSPYTEEEALRVVESPCPDALVSTATGPSRPQIVAHTLDEVRDLPGYEGSYFAEAPEAALGILLAPSNDVQIGPREATTRVWDSDGKLVGRTSLFDVKATERVYFGCPECGYESAHPLERRTRIGGKAKTPQRKGLDVCCCTSLAVVFPELDSLRRPHPETGELPHGTEVPAKTKGTLAHVRCSVCERVRTKPIEVKRYVTNGWLPLCEACRAKVRVVNLGEAGKGKAQKDEEGDDEGAGATPAAGREG